MNVILSNSSSVPLYEQIATQIKGQILDGRLEQGEALPSIRGLAKDLAVSIITTKRAYEELEAEGFCTTVAGKGTFVQVQNPQRLLDMHMREIDSLLEQAVQKAKMISVPRQQLLELVTFFYEEESV